MLQAAYVLWHRPYSARLATVFSLAWCGMGAALAAAGVLGRMDAVSVLAWMQAALFLVQPLTDLGWFVWLKRRRTRDASEAARARDGDDGTGALLIPMAATNPLTGQDDDGSAPTNDNSTM